MTETEMREWWRDAVIYQVYPRSYQDSDGDGIGDLQGIIARLPHIASLGVDVIWLSPFFTSPDRDMGYDVSDYCGVNPLFGTIADFEALTAKAHDLGLKVIIDQVLSHSSDQHPWFTESRASRDNPKADWYVWADPKQDGTPPNNWPSVFGGSAWTFDTRRHQYYLHNFLTEQPDLNFHNPDVVEALLGTMRFWLERGVDGFRLDTVNYYVHDARLRDNPASEWTEGRFPGNPYDAQNHLFSKSRPENIAVLEKMRALCDEFGQTMMVGEVGEGGLKQVELMGEYTTGADRLHMAYSFAMLSHDHSAAHFRRCIETFFTHAPEGWPCWSFSNHDVQRHVSRWTPEGGDHTAVAKQAIALLTSFPGTLGLYQGEELGQLETDILFEELQDKARIAFWPEDKGRDGSRSPMTWDSTAPYAGFSTVQPWLPVKAPQIAQSLDLQEAEPASVLHAYRAAIALRKTRPELRLGTTSFIDLPEPLLALTRTTADAALTAVFNLSETPRILNTTATETVAGIAKLTDTDLTLPAWGWAYLAGSPRLSV